MTATQLAPEPRRFGWNAIILVLAAVVAGSIIGYAIARVSSDDCTITITESADGATTRTVTSRVCT